MKKYKKPIYYIGTQIAINLDDIEDYTQIAKSVLDSLLHKKSLHNTVS